MTTDNDGPALGRTAPALARTAPVLGRTALLASPTRRAREWPYRAVLAATVLAVSFASTPAVAKQRSISSPEPAAPSAPVTPAPLTQTVGVTPITPTPSPTHPWSPAIDSRLVPTAQARFKGMPGSRLPVGVEPERLVEVFPKACDPVEKPGPRRFFEVFHAAYRVGKFGGITRMCNLGSDGEHKEGRALDWMIDSTTVRGRVQGDNIAAWLTANNGRNARSLGIQYIIWRDLIWRSYPDGWGPQYAWTQYADCTSAAKRSARFQTTCHRDHLHITFTWDGAYARTSFWTGRVLADNDEAFCRAVAGEAAPIRTEARVNTIPCPVPAPQPWTETAVGGRRLVLGAPGARTFKALLARATGVRATAGGTLDWTTRERLRIWQRGHGLPESGVADLSTWASLRTALRQKLPRA